ncbi:hypothetical protein MASR2M70_04390 [Bacillota bacterium]
MHVYLCDIEDAGSSEETILKFCLNYADDVGADPAVRRSIEKAVVLRTPKGKPFLRDSNDIYFSVSHSGSVWGCAIDSSPLGFDIEDPARFRTARKTKTENNRDSKWAKLAKRYFTGAEYDYVLWGGEMAFLKLWVRKEAYLKYKGSGLSGGLESFELIKNGRLICKLHDGWVDEIQIDDKLIAAYSSANRKLTGKIIDCRKANGLAVVKEF